MRLSRVSSAKGLGALAVAAADQQLEVGAVAEQFGEAAAEHAIAAKDQYLHANIRF
jgi:hypothetical protein